MSRQFFLGKTISNEKSFHVLHTSCLNLQMANDFAAEIRKVVLLKEFKIIMGVNKCLASDFFVAFTDNIRVYFV